MDNASDGAAQAAAPNETPFAARDAQEGTHDQHIHRADEVHAIATEDPDHVIVGDKEADTLAKKRLSPQHRSSRLDLAAGPSRLSKIRHTFVRMPLNRNPLYHDVSPSKPIEFEDVEEPTSTALLKALETIEDSMFGFDAAPLPKTRADSRSEAKKSSKSMPLPTNALAAAVAAAKKRMDEPRDEDEDKVSMRNVIERMPSDRQTYRSAHKQSLEWTRIIPHIRARGYNPQAKSSNVAPSALELEGIQAYLTPSINPMTPTSPSRPPFASPSTYEQLEIEGSCIKPVDLGTKGSNNEGVEEEVIASHGSFTEHFALHDGNINQHISSHHSSSFQGKKTKKAQELRTSVSKALSKPPKEAFFSSSLARPGLLERDDRAEKLGLPPMEPSRNLLSQAVDVLMDRLWSKILPSLIPLVMQRIESRRRTTGETGSLGVARPSKRQSGISSNLEALPESETLDHFEGTGGRPGSHRRNRSSGGHINFFAPSPRNSLGGNSPGPASPFKRKSWYDGIGTQSTIEETKTLASPAAPSPLSHASGSDPMTGSPTLAVASENSTQSLPASSSTFSPRQHLLPPRTLNSHQSVPHHRSAQLSFGPRKQSNELERGLAPLAVPQSSPEQSVQFNSLLSSPLAPSPLSQKMRASPPPYPHSSHVNHMALPPSSNGMYWQSASSSSASPRTVSTTNSASQRASHKTALPPWLSRRSLPSISPSLRPQGPPPAVYISEMDKTKTFPFPSAKKTDE